jgi:exodeoxyribonuclease VII large subunit
VNEQQLRLGGDGEIVGGADGEGADDDAEATFTVGELNRVIAGSVVDAFPRPVWVRGEIQQFTRSRNGHIYFELVEKDPERDRVRAVVRVVLFRDDRAAVNRMLRDTPGIKVGDGVEVRIRGRLDYYATTGRLQLVMSGIDPVFTVGQLAADRERVLRALAAEGVLGRNAGLELSPVPLRVGLVASGGSAAYHDFVHGLENSGHAFRIAHVDIRVQGDGSSRRIAGALRRLAAHDGLGLDVIVLVRGGGARSDLAPFDADVVARAITEMPVPVVTGIGHEVDRTVADEVAHIACKTPTEAATFLIAEVDDSCARLDHVAQRISSRARSACTVAHRDVADLGRRVARGALEGLEREGHHLGVSSRRAAQASRGGVRRAHEHLAGTEARLRALDPRRVLERGYSITRDASGALVRSSGHVAAGDRLVTETASGSVRSVVEPEA